MNNGDFLKHTQSKHLLYRIERKRKRSRRKKSEEKESEKKKMAKPYTHILDFWFGPKSSVKYLHPKPFWYGTTPVDDTVVRLNLGPYYDAAQSGCLDDWQHHDNGEGALALILLLDQVPRNIFRGTARAYATDAKALNVARYAMLEHGWGGHMPGLKRRYLYSPFNHSEDLRDQEVSVRLFGELGDRDHLFWARRFCEQIKRDGRFVHRDGILGR